jgi:hypothetical protein
MAAKDRMYMSDGGAVRMMWRLREDRSQRPTFSRDVNVCGQCLRM